MISVEQKTVPVSGTCGDDAPLVCGRLAVDEYRYG